ncbi:phytosulfokines 1-like [Lolium rigidum]|uniref:phytosulfokines 1-like n=1 Tax=Lolium rigidum TaxID=89674 RepID=UPI001F5D736D|nr:phytosulfokines 1-like [Lolium rigidum]
MVRLCLVCLALLLLTQDVYSRKISGAVVQEEQSHGHGTATTEPRGEEGGSEGANQRGQPQREPTKWEEIHTDYIYTQDVKDP